MNVGRKISDARLSHELALYNYVHRRAAAGIVGFPVASRAVRAKIARVAEKGGYLVEKIESRAESHTPRFDGARRRRAFRHSAGAPHGFTHLPLAFDDLTAASTNARPLTPSSMVGKWTDLSGFLPTRAALMASATSE